MELQAMRQAFCMLGANLQQTSRKSGAVMKENFITPKSLPLKSVGGFPLTSVRVGTDAEGALHKERKLVHLEFLYIIKEIFHYSHIQMSTCCTMSFMINNGWTISK